MTTEELLTILADRGLSVVLCDGQPKLRGPTANATPTLLRAIGFHREALASRAAAVPSEQVSTVVDAEPVEDVDIPEPLTCFCPFCEQHHGDVPWWAEVADPLTDPITVDERGLHCSCGRCI